MQKYDDHFWAMVSTSLGLAGIAGLVALVLTGCSPTTGPRPPRPTLADTRTVPVVTPEPVAVAPVPEPQLQPVIWQALPEQSPPPIRRVQPRKPVPSIAAGGKVIVYELGQKYLLHCTEFGTLTISLPEGELVRGFNSGASQEWLADPLEGPTRFVTIKRTPFAPRAEFHIFSDSSTYQFILVPAKGGVSTEHPSLIQIYNPETEARRAEQETLRQEMLERRRREAAERVREPYDYVRAYRLGSETGPILNEGGN